MPDFLLEIGLEEVPARMLAAGERELGERVRALLERERLLPPEAPVETFSTPRRLAVLVRAVAERQPDAEERLTGPAWAIAFKDGAPTPAAHAFARKAGVPVEALQPLATPKGEYVSALAARPGRPAGQVIAELLPKEIAALAWPKPMYWRAGKPERFIRPVQWLVALLGEMVIPVAFAGVHAGRETRGHRILHGPAPVLLTKPAAYVETLRNAYVLVDVEARRHSIRKALDRVTRTVEGARWREDEKLVDTVTHLTEWPSVLVGHFAPEYLALPEEVLVTVMRDHQKYFAVESREGKLLPHFLAVLNTEADERAQAIIRHGNERVLRARFSDAQFFWNFDARTPLEERRTMLASVTFHKDLGSYEAKTVRTLSIAISLAEAVQRNGATVDEGALRRAAELAKVDLTTELVKEFTELQGIVGGLYARANGEPEAITQAIYWQYSPASVADPIPPTIEGQILGLADRIGTLMDLFALGLAPSGSRDPYALRRQANAAIKILALSKLPLTLSGLLAAAGPTSEVELLAFLRERIGYYLQDVRKLPSDAVSAVLAAGFDDVPDTEARVEALAEVRGSDDLLAISAASKRTKNILRQAAEKHFSLPTEVDAALFAEEGERELHIAATGVLARVERLAGERNYRAALQSIATLRPAVDRFFDQTMVMVEDPALRANRLALLQHIVTHLGRIADFSELAPA